MLGAHQNKYRLRGWQVIALRWLAALVVLAALLHFLPWEQLKDSLRRVPLTRFVVILAGYLLAHAVGSMKWRMVVNAAGAQLDYSTSVECYAGGLFATLFLPSIIGGDVVRLAVGLRRSPNPAAVLAGNIADRFLDVLAQVALVGIGLILLPGSVPAALRNQAQKVVLILAIGAVVATIAAVFLRGPLLRGRSFRFRRRLARLQFALRTVSRKPHVLFLGWLLGTGIQTTFVTLTALLAISCGLFLPLRAWFFAWPLAKLAAVLPLTQGGIGVREAALVVLLSPFGAPGPLVLAAGLIWEGVVIVGGLTAGLIAFLLRRSGDAPISD